MIYIYIYIYIDCICAQCDEKNTSKNKYKGLAKNQEANRGTPPNY